METGKKYFLLNIITLALGLFIVFFWKTNSSFSSETIIHKDSLIVYLKDTAKHSNTSTNLQSISNTYISQISGSVDTAAVIKSYFTKRFYKQIVGDSLISITTNDSIYQNNIDYSNITWQFKKPYQVIKTYTITETKTIDKTKGFYVGVFVDMNKQIFGIGPQADFVFKKNNVGLGLDLLNRSALVKYTYKIGK